MTDTRAVEVVYIKAYFLPLGAVCEEMCILHILLYSLNDAGFIFFLTVVVPVYMWSALIIH